MPRHVFTTEERVRGGKQRFEDIMNYEPELLLWLKKKIRAFNNEKKDKRTCGNKQS